MKRILIIGAGQHSHVVREIILMRQLEAMGPFDTPPKYIDFDCIVVAIGDNRIRAKVVKEELGEQTFWRSCIHPTAHVSSTAYTGKGSQICAMSVVGVEATVGDHAIINTLASVDHHCAIEDFAHIAPGAHLGGAVHVGEGSLIGMGAIVLPRIKVGNWATVGAGAVVTKDVPDGATVVGIPARIVKKHESPA